MQQYIHIILSSCQGTKWISCFKNEAFEGQPLRLGAVDNGGGSAVDLVHTLHKGQGPRAPGYSSQESFPTMNNLDSICARVESARRDRLRKVVLRRENIIKNSAPYSFIFYRRTFFSPTFSKVRYNTSLSKWSWKVITFSSKLQIWYVWEQKI